MDIVAGNGLTSRSRRRRRSSARVCNYMRFTASFVV